MLQTLPTYNSTLPITLSESYHLKKDRYLDRYLVRFIIDTIIT